MKRIEKKIIRAQKIQRLKKRERQNWVSFMILFIKNMNAFTMNNIVDVNLNKQFQIEKYFDITKFFIYIKKNILKLKNFIRTCHNVFFIKFMIYKKNQFKINFAMFLLFNHVSNSIWIWLKYRLNFNVAKKSFNTWTKFCQFLKKHVNFIKFRIVNVKTKLHAIKQRANQTMFQLMIYFKTLKNQWTFSLSNSMKTNYLIQIFHENIFVKNWIDETSTWQIEKSWKKTIFNIKNIEKKFVHFRKNRDKNSKNKNFKKWKHDEINFFENRFNAVTNSNKKFLNKKKRKIKKTNEIWQK